jgi:hypothetical protein
MRILVYSALIASVLTALPLLARSNTALFVLAMPGFYAVMFGARQSVHELNWYAVECVNFIFYFGVASLFLQLVGKHKRKGAESRC